MSLSTHTSSEESYPEFPWTRLAHAHIHDLTTGSTHAPRVLVIGTAGSGKSFVLRHLSTRMRQRGEHVTFALPDHHPGPVPSASVLFVDDAHRLSDAQLAALESRLDDDAAGVVLACRPWPRSERLRLVARRLEQGRPPIVLGQLTAPELRAHLQREGRTISDACVTSIVELCGSVTWLIREALIVHGEEPCTTPDHEHVQAALTELIAERLRTVDPAVASHVERESLGVASATPEGTDDSDATGAAGYAEGLLLRNGRPAPVVRNAVLAMAPVERLAEMLADEASRPPSDLVEQLAGIADPRVAAGMLRLGDAVIDRDPARAAALYRNAEASGGDPTEVAVRLALTSWARGHTDRAGSLIDQATVPGDHPAHDTAVDICGSVWAARGLMDTSASAYAASELRDPLVNAHAAIAALGAGNIEALTAATDRTRSLGEFPSALAVSMRMLERGLRAGLATGTPGGLDDMVRAAETYTEASARGPIPELPAVLAALTAMNLGEVDVAHATLVDALRGAHGGAWARPRLLLWTAWVALRRQHPEETALRLENVHSMPGKLSARDTLLRDAVIVAHTRRYGDASTLQSVWQRTRDDVLHVEPDLFNLLPIAEFVSTAAILGDTERFDSAFTGALSILARLGEPPAWSAPLHWAGVQRGILLRRPAELAEHARALVAAAPHSRVAAAMSAAGKAWTEILTGVVDTDAIEAAATRLAEVGLAWDGARLASHGAGHTEDRRIVARLLSTARQLHPNLDSTDEDRSDPQRSARPHSPLSARELEVASLVISGKTYAEIGETIFISPRTAEHHIARIRRRLGATSRSDLIGKLRTIVENSGSDHRGDRVRREDPPTESPAAP